MPRTPNLEARERAAEMLGAGRSIPKVATALEVNEKTVDRWKHEPPAWLACATWARAAPLVLGAR